MQVKSECVDVIDSSEVFFKKYYSEVREMLVRTPVGPECHLNLKFCEFWGFFLGFDGICLFSAISYFTNTLVYLNRNN